MERVFIVGEVQRCLKEDVRVRECVAVFGLSCERELSYRRTEFIDRLDKTLER